MKQYLTRTPKTAATGKDINTPTKPAKKAPVDNANIIQIGFNFIASPTNFGVK